ncbi:MAG: hypothetical protein IPG54_03820 [Sphingomonadales bacterium]|nr:hypothetical protein [Sphingomonadales bacterium]MBK9003102.1 hypothetical protein [Sphingomonadales bacterium]MBK9268350.1 hypothetical protein [Sphingomonadales bacterium]MBP6435163.1 hypothetical protein [Sphingorhabdus sp.]
MANELLNPKTAAWPATLAGATILGSLALACVFPFAAIAALAALTLDRRAGIALVGAVWAANQAVGFLLMNFPWDAQAVGHGIAILAATLAGFGVARMVASKIEGSVLRSVAALASAFAVYQVLLRAYAQIGGGAENFSAEIVSGVAINDAMWFVGLLALRWAIGQVTGEKTALSTAR